MSEVLQQNPKIQFCDVHKWLNHQHILRGVNLSVYSGESLVILGRSGGGKSVLLKHLIGLIRPDAGEIYVDGQDISRWREQQLTALRRKVAMVFQGGALFDSMTVEENVAFPLREEHRYNEEEIQHRVKEMLEAVDMLGQEHKMPAELSGGMKKRVALARSIIRMPEVILYDEPTAGLDPIMTANINRLIRAIQQRFQTTSITISHDLQSAFTIADRIAFMHKGKIEVIGTPQQIRNSTNPELQKFLQGIPDETEGETQQIQAMLSP